MGQIKQGNAFGPLTTEESSIANRTNSSQDERDDRRHSEPLEPCSSRDGREEGQDGAERAIQVVTSNPVPMTLIGAAVAALTVGAWIRSRNRTSRTAKIRNTYAGHTTPRGSGEISEPCCSVRQWLCVLACMESAPVESGITWRRTISFSLR